MTLSTRKLGRTGWNVSEIGFGAWAIGGSWGGVAEDDAKGGQGETRRALSAHLRGRSVVRHLDDVPSSCRAPPDSSGSGGRVLRRSEAGSMAFLLDPELDFTGFPSV